MTAPKAAAVAQLVAGRAVRIPGIARLDAGPLRTKATYGPGARVDGVTVRTTADPLEVTVHAAVPLGQRIPELAEVVGSEVGDALSAAFPQQRWHVALDVVDVVLPGDGDPAVGLEGAGSAGAGRRELL